MNPSNPTSAVKARWELDNAAYEVEGRALVQGASLAVEPGTLVGVLGPNGAGKSTLLRLASGLIPASSGSVLLDGRPLTAHSRRQVARRIAFVPQDTHVEFDFTAFEIALMGRNCRLSRFQAPGQEDRQAVRRAMQWTGALDLAERSIVTLSGGERQRVFLARALATESAFVALDEPTANLDIEHALSFLSLARTLVEREGRGILMAMHDLNLALRFCDRIVLLDNGRIAALGTPHETLQPARIRSVFRVDAELLHSAAGAPAYLFNPLRASDPPR